MADAITILSNDHEEVRRLFSDLESTQDNAERLRLLGRIEQEVRIHTQVEEELFYPAYRDAAEDEEDKERFYEALEEHRAIALFFPEVKQEDPGTPLFKAKATVLKEMIDHHADEEEEEMFPKAREMLENEALENLGTEIERRKEELKRSYPAMDNGFMQARTAGAASRRTRP